MTGLRARFQRFVQSKQLVQPNHRVLVAVSGGVDSMVLLHLFTHSAAELGIEVVAAHFDHGMRPDGAADAAWVARVCAEWRVPLQWARAAQGLRSEAEARVARYAFLSDAMQRAGATRIATAHHADDQIETILFRLMRGAGLRGLSGIPLRRGAIIRPLLRFRKRELEQYAATHGVEFRADETNLSDQFARNRIRNALLPALRRARPESPSQILMLARHAARAERGWQKRIEQVRKQVIVPAQSGVSELARGILLEYDAETQARLLRAELRRLGRVPDRAAIERMLQFCARASSGSTLSVGGGWQLERAYDVVRIARASGVGSERTVRIAGCENGDSVAEIGGCSWRVHWTTSPVEAKTGARFDCAALSFPLEIRSWRPGDRMRMGYGSKKLKKLFAEARVPVHERAAVPILADAQGRICWVVGVARSSDAPAREGAPALRITVTDDESS